MKTTIKSKNKGKNTFKGEKRHKANKELIIWAPYYPYPMLGYRVGEEGFNMGHITPLLIYFILIGDLCFEDLFFSSIEEKIYIKGHKIYCTLLTNNIKNWILPDEKYIEEEDSETLFFRTVRMITEKQNSIMDKLESSDVDKMYKRLRKYYINKAENKKLSPLLRNSVYDKIIFKILFHGDIFFVEGKNMSFSECEKAIKKFELSPTIKYKKFARIKLYTSKGLKNLLAYKVKISSR